MIRLTTGTQCEALTKAGERCHHPAKSRHVGGRFCCNVHKGPKTKFFGRPSERGEGGKGTGSKQPTQQMIRQFPPVDDDEEEDEDDDHRHEDEDEYYSEEEEEVKERCLCQGFNRDGNACNITRVGGGKNPNAKFCTRHSVGGQGLVEVRHGELKVLPPLTEAQKEHLLEHPEERGKHKLRCLCITKAKTPCQKHYPCKIHEGEEPMETVGTWQSGPHKGNAIRWVDQTPPKTAARLRMEEVQRQRKEKQALREAVEEIKDLRATLKRIDEQFQRSKRDRLAAEDEVERLRAELAKRDPPQRDDLLDRDGVVRGAVLAALSPPTQQTQQSPLPAPERSNKGTPAKKTRMGTGEETFRSGDTPVTGTGYTPLLQQVQQELPQFNF